GPDGHVHEAVEHHLVQVVGFQQAQLGGRLLVRRNGVVRRRRGLGFGGSFTLLKGIAAQEQIAPDGPPFWVGVHADAVSRRLRRSQTAYKEGAEGDGQQWIQKQRH